MSGPVLVGDIGGTNARFAVAARRDGRFCIEHFLKVPGDEFESFEAALAHYLSESGASVEEACFAFAGPVMDGEVKLTNRNWRVSASSVRTRFGFRRVEFLNDFHAMARAIPEFEISGLEEVVTGNAIPGAPVLVTGPGTGLGVATLLPGTDGGWQVLSGEGGHMAYPPRTETEFRLAELLIARHGYVSNELVASGSGLDEVHSALCYLADRPFEPVEPSRMTELAEQGDEFFRNLIEIRACAVMGAAGDLVLANGALGGVVLAGGVSAQIAEYLKSQQARERFASRGLLSHYLDDCPVWLIRDASAPLIGAAAYYEQLARI